jgi:hypothetical protein
MGVEKRQEEEDRTSVDGLEYNATATFKNEAGIYITYRLKFNPVTKKAAVVDAFEAGRLPNDAAMALMEAKKDLVLNVFNQEIKKENV